MGSRTAPSNSSNHNSDMNQMLNSNHNVTQAAAMPSRVENRSDFVAPIFPRVTGKATGMRPGPTTITRVLRHRVTGLYFCDGHWTQDPFQATDFADGLEAAQACVRYGLTQVELSMHLGKCAHDFFNTTLR